MNRVRAAMGDEDHGGPIAAVMAEFPTLGEMWGCEECQSVRRHSPNYRCVVCGSQSVFDIARVLRERAERDTGGDA